MTGSPRIILPNGDLWREERTMKIFGEDYTRAELGQFVASLIFLTVIAFCLVGGGMHFLMAIGILK